MNRIKLFIYLIFLILLIELPSYFLWEKLLKNKNSAGIYNVKKIIQSKDINKIAKIKSHPYSLYWNNENFSFKNKRIYSSKGYRSSELDNNYQLHILALGGSTTNSFPYVKENKKLWTKILEEKLSKFLNIKVLVSNAGLQSATSQEILIHFLQNGIYTNPDLVIIHSGGNDVGALLFPDYKTDYSHIRSSSSGFERKYEKIILKYSFFLRIFYSVWLNKNGIYKDYPYDPSKLDKLKLLERVKENKSPVYRNNLSIITRETINIGSKVLFVGYLHDTEENRILKNLENKESEEAYTIGVNKHHMIMKNIANEYGQFFLKLNPKKYEKDFLDHTHLNEKGHKKKANDIYNFIINEKILSNNIQ